MKANKYKIVEAPEINITKEEKAEFDLLVLKSVYLSLSAEHKLSEEQIEHLDQINNFYRL